MRPISIVRDEGLKELLYFLKPNSSKTHISALIHKDFKDIKVLVKEQLKGNTIALITDTWTSRTTQAFATTTTHFIDKQWNLMACVIETVHFLGHHAGILISQKVYEASIAQTRFLQLYTMRLQMLF